MDKNLFYNPQKMLSYNRILNFVTGARGYGKSYAFKKFPIDRFLKTGAQWIYLRRYKDDLKMIDEYFQDIQAEYPDNKLEVKGKKFYIDGVLAGWAIPLSQWQKFKSTPFPRVETIIYDEALKEKDNSRYLPNEPRALLNFMDTVNRLREGENDKLRCVCLSNAVSVVNPFYLYFKIVPNLNKRFNASESVLVEICESKDYSEQQRKTRFGKLIDGTDYGDMSLDNQFTEDNYTFVEKRTKDSRYVFTVVYKGMSMGVWNDVNEGMLYMSNDHDPSSKRVYALTKDDMTENIMLMHNWKKCYDLHKLVIAFTKGYLRFDNQIIRTVAYEMFNKMSIH